MSSESPVFAWLMLAIAVATLFGLILQRRRRALKLVNTKPLGKLPPGPVDKLKDKKLLSEMMIVGSSAIFLAGLGFFISYGSTDDGAQQGINGIVAVAAALSLIGSLAFNRHYARKLRSLGAGQPAAASPMPKAPATGSPAQSAPGRSPVPSVRFCPFCGRERGSATRFCPACGKPLSQTQSAAYSPPKLMQVTVYPGALDYKGAILKPEQFLLDPILKQSRPVLRKVGATFEPYHACGGFACVYKFEASDGTFYAFRCWSASIGDASWIYKHIDAYLNTLKSRYFVNFCFLPQSILVKGIPYPGIRMDWVESESLLEFVQTNLGNPPRLEAAAQAFLDMVSSLHRAHVAHGDLQSDNLKVRANNGCVDILLIDYDTLFVPALTGAPALNPGLASYQHPRRPLSKEITEKDDYFSELVIYLALISLARCEEIRVRVAKLMANDQLDKDFLFSAQDFANPTTSELFQQLRACSEPGVAQLTETLIEECRTPSIDQLRPLELVVGGPGTPVAEVPPPKPRPALLAQDFIASDTLIDNRAALKKDKP